MSAQKHAPSAPAVQSWAGADEALREVRELEAALARREADKADALREVQERWDADIMPLQQRHDALVKALEDFTTFHRADLGDAKSRELNHGRLGFRLGQPALALLKKWTWGRVLEGLQDRRAKKFIAVKASVNREALLRSGLDAEALKGFGVAIEQAERFFYEIKGEETVSTAEPQRAA